MSPENIIIQGPFLEKADLCEPILKALPEWFGLEESNIHYLDAIDRYPTFLALTADSNLAVGFLTIYQHYPQAAEIYVTGVLPDKHRQGLGKTMLQTAETYLRGKGVEYLQVKTLGPSHSSEDYAKTRAFYLAMGFVPLEEIRDLWDEANPALLMIKKL